MVVSVRPHSSAGSRVAGPTGMSMTNADDAAELGAAAAGRTPSEAESAAKTPAAAAAAAAIARSQLDRRANPLLLCMRLTSFPNGQWSDHEGYKGRAGGVKRRTCLERSLPVPEERQERAAAALPGPTLPGSWVSDRRGDLGGA